MADENKTVKDWWVYIVECNDGSYYTGISNDVIYRVSQHNLGQGAKYTNSKKPVTLVYSERLVSRSEALKKEYLIKQLSRFQKQQLVEEFKLNS
jgi:putative endonuclease